MIETITKEYLKEVLTDYPTKEYLKEALKEYVTKIDFQLAMTKIDQRFDEMEKRMDEKMDKKFEDSNTGLYRHIQKCMEEQRIQYQEDNKGYMKSILEEFQGKLTTLYELPIFDPYRLASNTINYES